MNIWSPIQALTTMTEPHPTSSWYSTTATDKNSSQISGPKLQQGLSISEKEYKEILRYCASEINKASSGKLAASGPVRNGVKRTVFDLLDTEYGNVFKRPDLPSEFEAFALAAKKSIWRHVTTNRRGGVEVTMADAVQKCDTSSSREQSVDSSRSRAASEAAQVLGGLSIKTPQQPNTTPAPFYEMSFAVYSFPDKTPFTGAPIPYGFALQTKYEHLLSDSPEKINAYHCGYNKLQAAMRENFSADEYRDGLTVVDLATGTPILNDMNLAFTVLSAKKAGLDIIMIGVKDPNRITKRKRFYHLYEIV
jgi:hypothetical protein